MVSVGQRGGQHYTARPCMAGWLVWAAGRRPVKGRRVLTFERAEKRRREVAACWPARHAGRRRHTRPRSGFGNRNAHTRKAQALHALGGAQPYTNNLEAQHFSSQWASPVLGVIFTEKIICFAGDWTHQTALAAIPRGGDDRMPGTRPPRAHPGQGTPAIDGSQPHAVRAFGFGDLTCSFKMFPFPSSREINFPFLK